MGSSSDSDRELFSTPPRLREAATNVVRDVPTKSSEKYNKQYQVFKEWCADNNVVTVSENIVLDFFKEKSSGSKNSTLWSMYSMLKTTIKLNDNVDISGFTKLKTFLKRNGDGFKPTKSKIFSRDDVNYFLQHAPDETFLLWKIALIMGLTGAMRCCELTNLKTKDVEKNGRILIVNIPITVTKSPRTFIITEHIQLFEKYWALRPIHAPNDRFFLNFRKNKCSIQPVGINTFAKMPFRIAKYLNKDDPQAYTGHCFRRTSVSFKANGGHFTRLKIHGEKKSSSVAEGYVRMSTSNKIGGQENTHPVESPDDQNNDQHSTSITNVQMEDDFDNYLYYRMMGKTHLRIKPGRLPSRFDCHSTRLSIKKNRNRDSVAENLREKILVEALIEQCNADSMQQIVSLTADGGTQTDFPQEAPTSPLGKETLNRDVPREPKKKHSTWVKRHAVSRKLKPKCIKKVCPDVQIPPVIYVTPDMAMTFKTEDSDECMEMTDNVAESIVIKKEDCDVSLEVSNTVVESIVIAKEDSDVPSAPPNTVVDEIVIKNEDSDEPLEPSETVAQQIAAKRDEIQRYYGVIRHAVEEIDRLSREISILEGKA